jgi:hypothetical protein
VAGGMAVDLWRNAYTLNFQQISGPGGRPEPSLSEWIPDAAARGRLRTAAIERRRQMQTNAINFPVNFGTSQWGTGNANSFIPFAQMETGGELCPSSGISRLSSGGPLSHKRFQLMVGKRRAVRAAERRWSARGRLRVFLERWRCLLFTGR